MSVSGSMPKACCTLPPVQAEYTPKGTYTTLADLKTYVIGPEDAQAAIVLVYDIFGYTPQILQGADLLASQGYRVIMPDFLKDDYAQPSWFDGSEEGNKKKGAFFSKFPGSISSQAEPFAAVVRAVKATASKVGVAGYCWGYKVIVTSEGGKEVDAIAGMHPSFIAEDDVDKINVPLCMLPSQGEDMDIINAIMQGVEKKAAGKNFMKHYPNEPHGWLAARADLSGNEHTEAFHDGYSQAASFFKRTLA